MVSSLLLCLARRRPFLLVNVGAAAVVALLLDALVEFGCMLEAVEVPAFMFYVYSQLSSSNRD